MSKKLSKMLALLAILVGTSIAPVAKGGLGAGQVSQGGIEAAPGGGGKIKQALAQLDLTESQKQEIKKIVAEVRAGSKSVGRGDTSSSSLTGAKGKMRNGEGKELIQKILTVLTPEQKAKLKAVIKPAGGKSVT